jgi:hypothetical protein
MPDRLIAAQDREKIPLCFFLADELALHSIGSGSVNISYTDKYQTDRYFFDMTIIDGSPILVQL